MKNRSLTLSLLTFGFVMLFVWTGSAANPARRFDKDVVWTKNANKHTGLYTQQNSAIANGITLSFNVMYYYGDVDEPGVAFKGGFQPKNLSFGGSFAFAYTTPAGKHSNWRFGLALGQQKGDNRERYEEQQRLFHSFFGELSAGIEWYPFERAGFYLYAGVAIAYSHINYQYQKTAGVTNSFLPMIPLEIGYDFKIGKSFGIKLSVSGHQGLCDTPYLNLDGYPMVASQNKDGINFGRGGGNKWADGYFQIGVSFTYRWHNCEACRLYKW